MPGRNFICKLDVHYHCVAIVCYSEEKYILGFFKYELSSWNFLENLSLGTVFQRDFLRKKKQKLVVEADGNRLVTFYILKWFLKR